MKTLTRGERITSPKTIAGRLSMSCASGLLPLLWLLVLPAVAQDQFIYLTNNGAITITWYTGPGGAVDIPSAINGLPVTIIGAGAFDDCFGLTRVTIPNSITNIGGAAFRSCTGLTSVAIPNSVTTIGVEAFHNCYSLTSAAIPDSVTTIGDEAFRDCLSPTNVMIPSSVTNIGTSAFLYCPSMSAIMVDALNLFYRLWQPGQPDAPR